MFRLPVGDYRAWLDGELDAAALNTPSVLLQGTGVVTRTVDQRRHPGDVLLLVGRRLRPPPGHGDPGRDLAGAGRVDDVHRPGRPGGAGPQPLDDGWVTWRGANGNRVRIPVVIVR